MGAENHVKGQLFTHVYLDPGLPVQDNEVFRRRLGGYVQDALNPMRRHLAQSVKIEGGLHVRIGRPTGSLHPCYYFEDFFLKIPIQHVLNVITLIWRRLRVQDKDIDRIEGSVPAGVWRDFVARVLREENLGYSLDEECGVHYLVDEEFERNRVSLLRCLGSPLYSGVRTAFEDAHRHLDAEPRDPKAAVRSMFESLEILTRLMVTTRNLNKGVVENKLKQLAQNVYGRDDIAIATIGRVFDGFAQWVDGMHNYRHGQGKSDPIAPPVGFAIYVVSSGAAFLRLLVEIDHTLRSKSNPPLQGTLDGGLSS